MADSACSYTPYGDVADACRMVAALECVVILKEADDKTKDIEILESFLARPDLAAAARSAIEREIRNIRSGLKGEAEAAYELSYNYQNQNWVLIHDLRLEYRDRVAQIDHLLMNRFLDIYVCESKRFSEGVAINEQGEFSAFYNHRPHGIPSPIEQLNRHILLLTSLFKDGVVETPRRLGLRLQPNIEGFVLVSKGARISRPKVPVPGLDRVLKTDNFSSRLTAALDQRSVLLSLHKIISVEELQALARQLVALHRPKAFDWAAKFGVGPAPASSTSPAALPPAVPPSQTSPAAYCCEGCGIAVSDAVVEYCKKASRRFGGKTLCVRCQRTRKE